MPNDLIDILLVEDNPADVRLAKETLKDYKMQNTLHVVQDGEAALAYLRGEGRYAGAALPDLVLLDFALPKVDGVEVLRRVRQDERLRQLPVIVLISSNLDESVVLNSGIEADCCVLKPLTLERFLEAVRCVPHIGLTLVKIATA